MQTTSPSVSLHLFLNRKERGKEGKKRKEEKPKEEKRQRSTMKIYGTVYRLPRSNHLDRRRNVHKKGGERRRRRRRTLVEAAAPRNFSSGESSWRSTWNSYKVVKEAEPGKRGESPGRRGGMARSGVPGILITNRPRVSARSSACVAAPGIVLHPGPGISRSLLHNYSRGCRYFFFSRGSRTGEGIGWKTRRKRGGGVCLRKVLRNPLCVERRTDGWREGDGKGDDELRLVSAPSDIYIRGFSSFSPWYRVYFMPD